MPSAARTLTPDTYESTGGRLVSVDGRALPLIGANLKADAAGGLVRITLEQTFRNPHDEPLKVTYSLPLPADGAVSGFAFTIGDQRVEGQVDTRQRARQRFEDAILEGRTAAILDQERSSLFTQEVGNVPPRTQVVCEVRVDQKLTWLPDGAWEWRFPTVVAPRYLGAPQRVADHSKVTIVATEDDVAVRLGLALAVRDHLPEGVRPESPSHALHTARGLGRTDVTFADERGPSLDRDVVVRWRVATMTVGTALDVARPQGGVTSDAAYGLVTIVPPAPEAKMAALPRDLIVLLDTSGSMSGSPLDQARRVTAALVDTLTDRDQLELIEFSNSARRWKRGAVAATAANRRDAQAWLARLQASGSTEMKTGILEALHPLRAESQRQVILITDGLIGFENEVLEAISQRLPAGSRVHTVGVGSGVNRSLTAPAARAGRGVELVIGLGEDVEPFVKRLLARTTAPLLTDVQLSGSALSSSAIARLPDLYGGAPALLPVRLKAEGGTLVLSARSDDGLIEERLEVKPVERGEGSPALAALYARECVEELELAIATGARKAEIDPQIERLGVEFQISTRLTSWVAVSAQRTVDPRAPRRNETMPQAMAYGLSAEGVGLRAPSGQVARRSATTGSFAALRPAPAAAPMKSESRELERSRLVAPEPMEDAGFDEEADFADGASFAPRAEESLDEGAPMGAGAPPPAPMAPPPPARPGVAQGLKDFAKKLLKRDEAPEERPRAQRAAPATPKGKAAQLPRILRGRLVRRANGRLVIELDIAQPLLWQPAEAARVELIDGSLVKSNVVLELTTANGQVDVGLVVTLVVELDDRLAEPVKVHLASGAEVLEIVL